MERIKLKISDQKNPSTIIPSISLSAIIMISALITKRNIPRVRMVIGRVKRINNGLTIAFKKASTNAKMMAVVKSAI